VRRSLRPHLPTVAAFVACMLVAVGASVALPETGAPGGLSLVPRVPLELPGVEEDRDLDSYADGVDRMDGDLLVVVDLVGLEAPGRAPEPYVLIGTQDDHTRFGAGAELEWRHIVDHDPLGHRAGSRAWQRDAIRTGVWVMTVPHPDLERGIAAAGNLTLTEVPAGATWPQRLPVNVRDDRDEVRLRIELYDGAQDPHALLGAWDLRVDVVDQRVVLTSDSPTAPGRSVPAGARFGLGTARGATPGADGADDGAAGGVSRDTSTGGLRLSVSTRPDLPHAVKQELAERWAPDIRFGSKEAFYPVAGEGLQEYHGFATRQPVLRTWDLGFNNGRDAYRLFLADYQRDGRVDHRDAALIAEVLEARHGNRVYAHVALGPNDQVILQYWFLYVYNFVVDELGRDIAELAHEGDREFVQLRFADLEEAASGMPTTVAYSQHYEGVVVVDPQPGLPPFHLDPLRPAVFVAGGSHASYPVAGDDRERRPAFVGFYDTFDGQGTRWAPGAYTVEVLGGQPWHMGQLWGPATRYARDLGTSFRPLLQHDFRYPYSDPVAWERHLEPLAAADAAEAFGGEA
jgi:hypothetical protein